MTIRTASADPSPAADAAFQRGREALKVGKYAEACAAFEDSQRLDPQLMTQFNIALCDEQLGKLASALAIHKLLVAKEDNPQRKAMAAETVAQLEARVPRLRIEVAAGRRRSKSFVPPGLDVTVNGVHATNFKDMPIDLGTSHVVASAPNFLVWSGDVTAKAEKERVVITIALEPDPSAGPSTPEAMPPPETRAPSPGVDPGPRKTFALVSIIAGGAAIGGGVTFGLLARSKWNQAKDACSGTICDTQAAYDRGEGFVAEARSRGTVSTVFFIAGGALVVGGVVLWVTAPKAAVALVPSGDGAGVTMFGRF